MNEICKCSTVEGSEETPSNEKSNTAGGNVGGMMPKINNSQGARA